MGVTKKNWGGLADFVMMTGLMAFILASVYSPLVKSESGPFMVLKGVLDPHFGPSTFGALFLAWATLGLSYLHIYSTGSNGGLYYWVEGRRLKEAQPFSRARGYGAWQGFYYTVFWCTLLALAYNAIFAVYAASPGSLPGDSISAWIYAFGHYHAVVDHLSSTGDVAYLPALVTWLTRAWPKQMMQGLGLLNLKHWYFETEDEIESAEAMAKAAELQAAAFVWTRMWR